MADIFLSYSKVDGARVRPLAEAFERRGYTVWWDRHVPPGSTWAQLIEDELDGAGCVVVVWSKASVLSEWVDIEAARAKRRGVLVPVMIDDVADDIPLEFSRLQAARLVDWERRQDESDFELLIRTIEKTLRRSKDPDAGKQKSGGKTPDSESAGTRGAAEEGRGRRASHFDAAESRFYGFFRRRRKLLITIAVAAALLNGIPLAIYYASLPTHQEVIQRYAARVDIRRSQLRAIAGGLPPKGSVQANTCGQALTPAPVYNAKGRVFNTDFLMDWELLRESLDDPEADGRDLYLSQSLEFAISWRLGSLAENVRREKDWGGEFAQKFEQAMSVRYLIVTRIVNDRQPAGTLHVEVFVNDLETAKQICSFPLTAEDLNITVPSSQFLRELKKKLSEGTGGTFEF